MSDSFQNIDKRCIFRETFESEQAVRRNGGVPTIATTTFEKGTVKITTSFSIGNINYRLFRKGIFSFRIKFKLNTLGSGYRYFFQARNKALTSNLILGRLENITSNINFNGGFSTIYLNNVVITDNTVPVVVNTWYEVVGITASMDIGTINVGYLDNETADFTFELLEVYQGALTAEEVKNLYENKRYKLPVLNHDEQLGAEIIPTEADRTFSSDTGWWTLSTGITISNNLCIFTNVSSGNSIYKIGILTIAKKYKITFTVNKTSGALKVNVGFDTTINTSGTHTLYLIPTSAGISFVAAGTTTLTLDNISIKEVLVNSTKEILNVSAVNGVIRNKYSGEEYGSEKITNQADREFSSDTGYWTKGSSVVIEDGVCKFNGQGDYNNLLKRPALGVQYKTYKLTFTVTNFTGGSADVYLGALGTQITGNGIYSAVFYSTSGANQSLEIANANRTNPLKCHIDNISLKEIIPSVISTSVEVVKENDVYAMRFNGSTSKIDCGSYDGLVGDKTFIFWIKRNNLLRNRRIIRNGQLVIYVYAGNDNSIAITSNNFGNSTSVLSSSFVAQKWINVVVVRKSDGYATVYFNSINTLTVFTGIPVAGSTIDIGYENSAAWFGSQSSVRIIDGILTPQEISALYSAEKDKYGL